MNSLGEKNNQIQMQEIMFSHCCLLSHTWGLSVVEIFNMLGMSLGESCNIPDPPTGEEDATIHQIIQASSPMNMKIHTYSVEE